MCIVDYGKALKCVGLAVLQSLSTDDLKRNIVVHTAGSQKPLKRVLDIVGSQCIAVGEDDPVFQCEGVGQTIVRNHMTLAEAGNDGRTAVRLNLRLKQAVKYVHRHHVVVCGLRNIHGADVIECCNTQHPLLNGRTFTSRGGCGRCGRATGCHRENACADKRNKNKSSQVDPPFKIDVVVSKLSYEVIIQGIVCN